MRGKGHCGKKLPKRTRITPAYAGKRPCPHSLYVRCEDHPRLCGEKRQITLALFLPAGSPPPMRGKAPFQKICQAFSGITPAYAGKSYNPRQVLSALRDHPRLCGEKSGIYKAMCCRTGSPPPMRGKVVRPVPHLRTIGITPAYAGKSRKLHDPRSLYGDHPRLCGEKPTWY